jgi:L-lactate dehydrogenase complex protein LldE
VLERRGVAVEFSPVQTCCGQPAFNAGFGEEARRLARRTIDLFSGDDLPVVVPSGSCADMIVHQFPVLLADDERYREPARALAARTFEFTQFLVGVLGVSDVGAHCSGCLAYHASCHGLRGLGLREEPTMLLDHVGEARVVPLEEADTCCGFGGLFAVKMPAISSAMLDRKVACIERSGADMIVTTDVSCGMHMAGALHRRGSRVRVVHIADLLAQGEGA